MEILGRRQRERMAFNKKRRRFIDIYYKKTAGSQLGLPGSSGFRVDPPGRPGFAGPNSRLVFSLTQPGSRLELIGSGINLPDHARF